MHLMKGQGFMEENNFLFRIELNDSKTKLNIIFDEKISELDLSKPIQNEMESLFEQVMDSIISKKIN
ncbi:hypothetical protein MSROBK_009750 [Spiroplasma poulsonii]|uniref:Uncharacterized protein n=2 Tax=Spiroplasma poulsonii TaxID=2138 RepID=A0A2P6FCF5_9MOLU|nr:hypothetical protein MSROBK_009750 [Spiroplasma poulsonii]PQM31137.1 hypothetical protein SMSRO_SF009400 [Spiroplasma poulsonii]PWF96139.1 hypothetical protein SMSE_15770 [Spiroplasma poulsonii]PWF98913.1 hypothetical protein SMH99_14760 [Spiroplasma poulsonii]